MSEPKKQGHTCPDGLFALGTHPYYCGEEPFIQATYEDSGCGCQIVGNGTLPHPLGIKWCAKHATASELLALLQEALRGGNANTRALKAAIEKASPGWCRDARVAIAKAQP